MELSPASFLAHRSGGGEGKRGRATSRILLAALLVSVVFVSPTVYLLSSSSLPLIPPSASFLPIFDNVSVTEPHLFTGARSERDKIAFLSRSKASSSVATNTDRSSPVEKLSPTPTTTSTTTTTIPKRTLVMYVYHESNEWYKDNLNFFIKVAMQDNDNDDVDYLIVINGESNIPLEALLEKTTAQHEGRVQLLRRPNTCYDGGSIGEVLRAQPLLAESYRYYVFMNSSVRGPFLPRYFQVMFRINSGEDGSRALAWTSVLTSLLDDEVKLAGTTISCEIQVHVQSMVLATDHFGLKILLNTGVLNCPASLQDAIFTYELGATAAILDAGFKIDSLLTRYKGIDWRQKRDLHCNAKLNPQLEHMNDGLGLDPFEVVFVKAKEYPLMAAAQAFLHRYTDYAMGRDNFTYNGFHSPRVQIPLAQERTSLNDRVLRCEASFDAGFYLKYNPDLVGAVQEANALNHFNNRGFVERRPYRYNSSTSKSRDRNCRWITN